LKDRKDGPWMTTFLTLSSHEPFDVPYNRLEDKIPNAFAFTDDCLGKFIEKLKQTPVWDNLLVVCIPDHGFRYPKEKIDRGGEFSHIPMLWLGGAVKQPMKVDKIMNQTDMAATLLGQLGLDHSMFTFSRNVLGSAYTYPFSFHCHGGGFAFRDSTGVSAYDTKANQISFEEPSVNEERLNRGKAILQSVYDDLGSR
jgi:phosphoglycerol transferase MdoB-like AlkP superfamily enzyme